MAEICKLCGSEFKSIKSLSQHIAGTHKMSTEIYYRDVLGNSVGICVCGKLTKYRNLAVGYSQHCSAKCSYHDPDVTAKRDATNLDKFGSTNAIASVDVRSRIANTNMTKYGGISPMSSSEVRDRAKEVIRDKYGVDSVLSIPAIRDKAMATMVSRYGENPFKSDIISDRRRGGSMDRYGVDHPSKSSMIQAKIESTNLSRYGVKRATQSDIVKAKIQKTNIDRYGVPYIPMRVGFMEQVTNTNIKKYGVEYVSKVESFKDKMRKTNLEKYGVEYAAASDGVRERVTATMLSRYGVRNCMQNTDIAEKTRSTMIDRYGVPYIFMTDDSIRSRRDNQLRSMHTKYSGILAEYKCEIVDIDADLFIGYRCDVCGCDSKESYQFITKCRHANGITPCTQCEPKRPLSSFSEREIGDFIKSLGFCVTHNNRETLHPHELDIYVESKSIAIEYNGLHYHSELYKAPSYHVDKTDKCNSIGIQLIHVFEDDWLYKRDIVKSRLKSVFGVSDSIIYARKCEIHELDNDVATAFLDMNHIQGSCSAKYRYGLFFNGALVAVMTFGKSRFEKDRVELLRFCNRLNVNVVGGAGKLFKHFISSTRCMSVISYADRCWSIGNLYEKLGFSLIAVTSPNYSYVVGDVRKNRMHYQKHKLVADGYDVNKTEREIMFDRGIYRIYDCGNLKYEWVSP